MPGGTCSSQAEAQGDVVPKRAQESLNSPGATSRATSAVQGPCQESHNKFSHHHLPDWDLLQALFTCTVDWLLSSDQQIKNTESWFGINTPCLVQTFKNLYRGLILCKKAYATWHICPCAAKYMRWSGYKCCITSSLFSDIQFCGYIWSRSNLHHRVMYILDMN